MTDIDDSREKQKNFAYSVNEYKGVTEILLKDIEKGLVKMLIQ